MQDTFFDSGRKCVAMVTAYYGKNGGKILRRELLPQFFTNSHKIWHRCLPWGVDVQDTFFDSGRKCVAMVTAYYGKNWGKILRRELLPQFFTNSHKIWHRCLPLGVDVQDTFFDSGRKCVAMVTAYYTVKKYCGAGVLITFSDISSLILGHVFTCLSKNIFKILSTKYMEICEAMTSTHSFAYSYRLFKKCFVENYENSTLYIFLIFNPIYIKF